MKKLASHILILITLSVMFGSLVNAQQDPLPSRNLTPSSTNTTPGGASQNFPTSGYHLLAPLRPDLADFNPSGENALGTYLNAMITIFIGICAVLAVVMIVIGGLEYMTSELPGNKEHGKERITGAVFGLVLALGAYALLYTINPNLLNSDLALPDATVQVVQDFQISGAQVRTYNGPAIKINFNKEAYPAASSASQKTGVDEALILAIFAQESGSGANTGGCLANDARAKMKEVDKTALRTIVGGNIDNINVSCAGAAGYGGAIGLTQFLPSTWLENSGQAAGLLGHTPDPWNVNDALMTTAVYLAKNGGKTDPHQAACVYFGKCSSGGIDYAAQVEAKMASLKQQIATAKGKGEIK